LKLKELLFGPRLVVDKPGLRVWSNGARDELVERLPDGSEKWRLYRDINDDSILETITVITETVTVIKVHR
jgi:hypothetical protein